MRRFIGGGIFCFKACDEPGVAARDELDATPNDDTSESLCINTLDLLGCEYNMPNNAKNGTYEYCQGEPQLPAGVYTGDDGKSKYYFVFSYPWF